MSAPERSLHIYVAAYLGRSGWAMVMDPADGRRPLAWLRREDADEWVWTHHEAQVRVLCIGTAHLPMDPAGSVTP